MKVLRYGVCFVDVDDVIFRLGENLHLDKINYTQGEMVELTDPSDIERVMNDKYITDYDDVRNLDSDDLEMYIINAEKELNHYCSILVNTPVNERKKLWSDKEFSRGYDNNTYKMDALRKYFRNKNL